MRKGAGDGADCSLVGSGMFTSPIRGQPRLFCGCDPAC